MLVGKLFHSIRLSKIDFRRRIEINVKRDALVNIFVED